MLTQEKSEKSGVLPLGIVIRVIKINIKFSDIVLFFYCVGVFFFFFFFLAHLSCQPHKVSLKYTLTLASVVVIFVVVVRQQCLNIFSSETALPIKAKFYVEPPWEGGTKVCSNGPGHMTKMAAMPIYGKNL